MKTSLLFLFACALQNVSADNFGSLPNFPLLRQADFVAIVDRKDISTVETKEGIGLAAHTVQEVNPRKILKGADQGRIKFIADTFPWPAAAQSAILYLKADDTGIYQPLSRLCSSIPSSLSAQTLVELSGETKWDAEDEIQILLRIFENEADGDSSLSQAIVLATSPASKNSLEWTPIFNGWGNPKTRLAQSLVGLYKIGPSALLVSTPQIDFSRVGITADGDELRPTIARAYLIAWTNRRKLSDDDASNLLKFSQTQSGPFKSKIQKSIPKNQLPKTGEEGGH